MCRSTSSQESCEVSIVMACYNEAETVGPCVTNAFEALAALGLQGEVIVIDNASTDGSGAIAAECGARVIVEEKRGYGYAYRRGFREAKGRMLVMADADGTYDFCDLERMLLPLQDGSDFVIGSRLRGNMLPGAMPWFKLHFGNRVATGLVNFLFQKKLSDTQSGFRSFRAGSFRDVDFRGEGMEFATEMIVDAFRKGLRLSEVPITYHPRRGGVSKYKIFQDSFSILRLIFASFLHPNGVSRTHDS
ncbi:MAG: glycosyltransferase family 2 protein [Candidatus Omnitrophota bacterium]